jgi:hypothetical protein
LCRNLFEIQGLKREHTQTNANTHTKKGRREKGDREEEEQTSNEQYLLIRIEHFGKD